MSCTLSNMTTATEAKNDPQQYNVKAFACAGVCLENDFVQNGLSKRILVARDYHSANWTFCTRPSSPCHEDYPTRLVNTGQIHWVPCAPRKPNPHMKNITVIGAGTMGNGIAHVFAQSGFDVTLVDISDAALKKALATIGKNLDRMIKKEKIAEADKAATLGRIQTNTDLASGVSAADLVVEAATENVDLKLKIFRDMDANAPKGCILSTNTSSISITKIAAVTGRPEQVIGMHFMNPVPVMKLVEVIRGYATSDATTSTVMEMSKSSAKCLWK